MEYFWYLGGCGRYWSGLGAGTGYLSEVHMTLKSSIFVTKDHFLKYVCVSLDLRQLLWKLLVIQINNNFVSSVETRLVIFVDLVECSSALDIKYKNAYNYVHLIF